MSRFLITNGSYFRPFSYDELAKPVQQMAEAHSAAADAYDQLSLETNALAQYISENEDDQRAKAMYNNYLQKLQSFQDNLWNNGYNVSTRRDLSAARNAYAQDITALKNAIETRQERSKEYWDARHKNPDLVMGFDPGTSGLDNYLGNKEYGRDWYSYNGNTFAAEVGEEAKARAAEFLSSAVGASNAPGYLEYIQKNGFSNQQVNNAGILAQQMLAGQISPDDPNLDPIESLLANTLITRLQATGAMPGKNISADEFGRMFTYGMRGLTQGIGDLNRKLIDDKVYDQRQRLALESYRSGLKDALKGLGAGNGVHRELVDRPIQSEDAAKTLSETSRVFDDATYADGATVRVNLPNGGGRVIHNAEEARQLFQTDKSNKFYDATGMDVRVPASNWWKAKGSKQTGEYKGVPLIAEKAGPLQVMFNKNINPGDVVVKKKVNGKWVYDAVMSDNYNRAKFEYDTWMKNLEASNPELNLGTIGLTPEEAKKLRKDYDIPAGVSDVDLRTAIESKVYLGNRYGVPIINGPEDDDIRIRFANNVNGFYANSHGNKSWKTIPQGFYRVNEGNEGVANENAAMTSLGNVFEVDKDSGKIDPKSIYAVYVMPQDIKNGNTKVRVETSKGTFLTDISLLGSDIDGSMNSAVTHALEQMMMPLNNTVDVLDRDNILGGDWDAFIGDALYGYDIPIVKKQDGGYRIATAQEVARDPRLQKILLDGINEYIQDAIAYGIDLNTLHPRQHVSYTSSKAEGMAE